MRVSAITYCMAVVAESAGLVVVSDLNDPAAPSTMPLLSKPLSLSLNKASEGDKKVGAAIQRASNAAGQSALWPSGGSTNSYLRTGVFGNDDTPDTAELGPEPSKPKGAYSVLGLRAVLLIFE